MVIKSITSKMFVVVLGVLISSQGYAQAHKAGAKGYISLDGGRTGMNTDIDVTNMTVLGKLQLTGLKVNISGTTDDIGLMALATAKSLTVDKASIDGKSYPHFKIVTNDVWARIGNIRIPKFIKAVVEVEGYRTNANSGLVGFTVRDSATGQILTRTHGADKTKYGLAKQLTGATMWVQ